MAVSTIGGNILAAGVLTVSITPVSVAASTSVEQSFTVPGVRVGDFVTVAAPSLVAGVSAEQARVSAANTVAITFQNSTLAGVVPAAGAYQFLAVRPESGTFGSFAP
jgi:hypothetical protein